MATPKVLPGWIYLGGKTRRYKNVETGEEISRRQYDKLVNPSITYEKKAAHNKLINPKAAVLKPARGRKSYRKAPEWVQEEIAEQRLEAEKKAAEEKAKAAETAEIERRNQRLVTKRVKVKKVRKHLFPKGKIGWRIAFNDYSDLKTLVQDAQKTKVIFSYAFGFVGVDTRFGIYRPVWIGRTRSIRDLVPEKEFNEMIDATLAQYAYMRLAHYFVQFAIEKSFVREQMEKPAKRKPVQKKTRSRGKRK